MLTSLIEIKMNKMYNCKLLTKARKQGDSKTAIEKTPG